MSKSLINQISQTLDNLIKNESQIAVSVSGGIDSMALLFIVKEWAESRKIQILAVTVNHNLREDSYNESRSLNKILLKNNINHSVLDWHHQGIVSNIESKARNARYNIISDFCKTKNIKILITGHTQDDLIENFFIRLERGSGIFGLSAIESEKYISGLNIIRPLLSIKKEELKNYLIEKHLPWFEDSTNSDQRFLRNKIRASIKDIIKDSRIVLSINHISRMKDYFLSELHKAKQECVKIHQEGYIEINLKTFLEYHKEIKNNIIIDSLCKVSGKTYKPKFISLDKITSSLISNKRQSLQGCIIETKKDTILIYREWERIPLDEIIIQKGKSIIWDNRFFISSQNHNILVKPMTHRLWKDLVSINPELKKNTLNRNILFTLPLILINNSCLIPTVYDTQKLDVQFHIKE